MEPYDGMAFGVCVKSTCVQGVEVYAEGRVTGAPGTGTFIRPARGAAGEGRRP